MTPEGIDFRREWCLQERENMTRQRQSNGLPLSPQWLSCMVAMPWAKQGILLIHSVSIRSFTRRPARGLVPGVNQGMALVNVLRRWDFTYHCFMDGDNVSMGLVFIMDVSPPLWESSCPIYWTCFFVDCLPRSSTSCSRCDCRRKFYVAHAFGANIAAWSSPAGMSGKYVRKVSISSDDAEVLTYVPEHNSEAVLESCRFAAICSGRQWQSTRSRSCSSLSFHEQGAFFGRKLFSSPLADANSILNSYEYMWSFPKKGVPLNHPFEWDFPL